MRVSRVSVEEPDRDCAYASALIQWLARLFCVSLEFLLFTSSLALNRAHAQYPAEFNNATGFFYSIIICSVINKLTLQKKNE